MTGLNTVVSENFPVKDGRMKYRDGSLTFIGSSAGIY